MEKGFDRCLDETVNVPGVTGVICADQQGLCLQSKGAVMKNVAGIIAELSQIAAKLEPDSTETPIIALESDMLNVYIKNVGEVTTAIFKASTKN